MVSFRKAFLLAAALVLVTGLASAQTTSFTCNADSGGNTKPLRAEGLAEQTGEIVLRCTGGTPTPLGVSVPRVNIQVYLNTNVTSRIVASGGVSEAMLLIDEPQPAGQSAGTQLTCGAAGTNPLVAGSFVGGCSVLAPVGNGTGAYSGIAPYANMFHAQQVGDSLVWNQVPLDPPGTSNNRVLRFVNIRANAARIGASSSFLPNQVVSFISMSGAAPTISNPTISVGAVLKSLSFGSSSSSSSAYNYESCVSASADSSGCGGVTQPVAFSELFSDALKIRTTTADGTAVGAPLYQNVPGGIYYTESMFTSPATGTPATTGWATQGTRLGIRVNNIPAGVTVRVPRSIGTSTEGARLLLGVDPTSGAGGTFDTINSGTNCSGTEWVTVSTGGNSIAVVYEMYNAPASQPQTLGFSINYLYAASSQVTGTVTVEGGYAPFYNYAGDSSYGTASSSLPVPRFVQAPSGSSNANWVLCRTNLLYPYVTAALGFDTGISIANTSTDPFSGNSSRRQAGTCTLNFYGTVGSGGAAPSPIVTPVIPTGTTWAASAYAYTDSTGATPMRNFSGYIIAQCNFRYAHGFAFVSDVGAQRLGSTYLALVMDSALGSRTGASSETLGN